MDELYTGRTALITGASAGIGKEFAIQMHAKGASVILLARREEQLKNICHELNQIRASSASYLVADLSDISGGLESVKKFIRSATIDIFVNNAGIGSFGFFEELPIERELEIVGLNTFATTALAHECLKGMKQRKFGAYISVASIAAFQPLPYMATYSASKAFNFIQTMALREELKKFNVRALTVCPGPTQTEFFGVARVPGTMSGGARDSVETVVSQSLAALEKNRAFVVTGFRSKLMSLASRFFPKTFSTWLVKKSLDPVMRVARGK